MWSLAGKKCIVTGGNQGIGFAIAKRFLGEGANVCLVGRNAARVDDAVRRLQPGIRPPESDPGRTDAQPRLHGHVCEAISGQKDWIELFAKHPDVDVLVNCAGVSTDRLLIRLDDDDVAGALDTNLRAAIWGCKHASRRMMARAGRPGGGDGSGGCIINVSSLLATKGRAGASVYAASKAGILGLTTSLSQELGRWGIRVNALVPGYIDTRMTENLSAQEELKDRIPLRRFGHVDEVADAAAFLAKNPYASNCILNLDGGLSAT
ncbi:hypothetical protein QBC33DRAFT_574920 [Phialemonium atrogriseum]|uniref:Uncharacterized protein n=1 Tax=Phialemonium atrogriseum TaxID=1093897 RepID=A0AAJ0C974_9PEZI|nr:uncharacterized protein QBC33DRAFT_574920 [Phialemonium atrogriseum]KAK1772285.1 hypothetical protein QBC33DRAFT_574920 [Phialemonium atrogriseum]